MNEKQFEISKDKYFIFDNAEDDFLDLEDVVIVLNAFVEKNEQLKEKLKDTTDEVEYWKDIVERYRSSANLDLEKCTIVQGNKRYVGKVSKFVKYENHSSIDLYDLKEVE